jgi:hypothetical protein
MSISVLLPAPLGPTIPTASPFSILNETFSKIQELGAKNAQTGPARRMDLSVIAEHEHLLTGTSLELYKLLTKSIIETYKND